MTVSHSTNLHSETELPGTLLPLDTLEIIKFRYDYAAPEVDGRRVLEVGVGPGLGLGIFGERARFLVGGDYSEENIRICRERYGDRQCLLRLDGHRLPFADGSFDVVVALAIIYYLEFDRFLGEAARVLRPGGRLVFCTSNKDVAGFVPAPYTIRYFSVPELAEHLRLAGFEPNFSGAFPAMGGSVVASLMFGKVKNVAKAVVTRLPFGDRLWGWTRRSAQGTTISLPHDVRDLPITDIRPVRLSSHRMDRIHRVVYVTASKILDTPAPPP